MLNAGLSCVWRHTAGNSGASVARRNDVSVQHLLQLISDNLLPPCVDQWVERQTDVSQ